MQALQAKPVFTGEQHAAKVAEACRFIETSEEAPSLGQLANHVGLSTYHFHRVFQAITGVTPTEYAAAHRAKRVRMKRGKSGTATEAIYHAGHNSNGRFYATCNAV